MAKTLFGALIVDARNKLGGHVLSKNKGGSFIRRKVSPTQPMSTAQRKIRAIVTQLARAWGGVLDDTKRQVWKDFSSQHPVTDVFGQNVILTGMQMYVRLNAVIMFLGAAIIDMPPDSLEVSAITDLEPSATETGPTFELAGVVPAALEPNELYVIWATKQVGVGKNALASLLTYITTRESLDFLAATIVAAPNGADRASDISTITTVADHGLTTGDLVVIEGVDDPSFDGKFLVAAVGTSKKFDVVNPGPDTTPGSGGGTVSGSDSIVADYVAKYGALEAGRRICVGVRVQNTATGASSPLVTKNITVGA
jgi:hypothetical protein